MSDDQGWMAVKAPRHNGLLQHRPQLRIPTPEASLVTPLCLSCAANSLLASRTGKSGNIRSLARSLARRLCRRCRGRTDGRYGRADGQEGERAARMVLNIAALTACASRHSPLTDGRRGRRGTGDGGRKGGCFHGKVAVPPPSSVCPFAPPSHDCRRHRGRNCRRQRCRHRRAEQGKGFSLRA